MKNIVIIEDFEYHREGIKGTIKQNFNSIGEFLNSQDFFEKYKSRENDTDVVLIDYELKKAGSVLNGDQIVKRLVEENYQAKLAIVTGYDEVLNILKLAKKNGAAGFSQKAISAERYKNFINELCTSDEFVVESHTKDVIISELLSNSDEKTGAGKFDLNYYHIEIVKMLIQGKNSEEIISRLFKNEFNEKLHNHSGYDEYFSFKKIISDITDEITGNKKTNRARVQNLKKLSARVEHINQQDICLFDKFAKLKNESLINKSPKTKAKLRFFAKQADSFLYAHKLKIKTELNLPDTKRETLIYGMILYDFITKQDIETLILYKDIPK